MAVYYKRRKYLNINKITHKIEGTFEITENGEYDVKTYAKVNVNVEGTDYIEATNEDINALFIVSV